MKRKQKRFAKQFEIESEIIAQKRKMKTMLAKAEEIEEQKRAQVRLANKPDTKAGEREFYMENSRGIQAKADKLRESAFRIETKKLPSLKNALAEFKTTPLAGILGDDKGVVLRD